MNDFDEAMIWKFKDVQDNKAMWKFCQEDFKQIFVEKSGKSFYNSLLNELVYELSQTNTNSQNDDMTQEKLGIFYSQKTNQLFSEMISGSLKIGFQL